MILVHIFVGSSPTTLVNYIGDNNMKAPCKDCIKRELGCHSKCADYQEYRKFQDRQNDDRRKELEIWDAVRTGSSRRVMIASKYRG